MKKSFRADDIQLRWEKCEENREKYPGHDECWVCGRGLSDDVTKAWFVHEVDGGGILAAVDDDDWDEDGDMGWFPVGTECARKIPREFRKEMSRSW